MDCGLEWCEDYFLKQKTLNWKTYFAGQLNIIFPEEKELKSFKEYLELMEVPEGTSLFTETTFLSQIYFLETGILDMIHKDSNHKSTRIKTIYPGVFLGESSLYLGSEQIFSCIAKVASTLYTLSFDKLIKMENENPRLALIFHRYMVCQTLNRLAHTHKTILSMI